MEISQIKQQLTIAQVLHYYSLKPDKNLRLHCPFHNDKTPSLQVYYKTNTTYCFSSNCSTHGKSLDVIDFILHKESVGGQPISKHNAILKAVEIINYLQGKVSHTHQPTPISWAEQQQPIFTLNGTLKKEGLAIEHNKLEELFIKMQHNLKQSTAAKSYCNQRGLAVEKLAIGYNGRTYNGVRNCIVFALKNKENKVTGLYGRSTQSPSPFGEGRGEVAKHFYLKESTGLYPNYPNPDTEKLIIAESIIDTASLLQIESIAKGYSLLAAYGTNRLNDEMQTAIKEWASCPLRGNKKGAEIIFAFDNDEAGRQAAVKYATQLISTSAHLQISTLVLPCKDVNETLIAHNEDIFLHLLEQRTNIFLSNEKENIAANLFIETATNPIQQSVTSPPSGDLGGFNTTNPNKIIYTTDTATYYLLGGIPKQLDNLKIMLSIEAPTNSPNGGGKARNKIDLYEDKQVEKLCKEVAEKLQLRQDLIEQDIYSLTNLVESFRESLPNPSEGGALEPPQHYFTLKERTTLEAFLKQPKVIKRLNEMLGKTGIVGEERNRIFLLLIAISYKMKDPLHSLIQGSSGSGKTKIVRQVSDCIPQENVTRFTRVSDKALYNYPRNYFTNRLLIIEDVDGLSEDAEMAFRELQSSGELRSSVSIKLDNGSITGGEKIVSGPIASMSCTTKGEIYEDNMSRVFLIAVDESTAQTKRIINYQNQKASGKINSKEEQEAKQFLQNIIRLIDAKEVINPFAEKIQLPEEAHKIRRLNDLFQNFIKMVALINQYQRKQNDYKKIIAEIEDIETAIEIMFESIVLKVDELDGSLRQFYEKLKSYLQKQYKDNHTKVAFTQREVRQSLHVSKAQINRYLQNLVDLEYLQCNGFANKGFKYKVAYWDNYEILRTRIKDNLKKQVEALKLSH